MAGALAPAICLEVCRSAIEFIFAVEKGGKESVSRSSDKPRHGQLIIPLWSRETYLFGVPFESTVLYDPSLNLPLTNNPTL